MVMYNSSSLVAVYYELGDDVRVEFQVLLLCDGITNIPAGNCSCWRLTRSSTVSAWGQVSEFPLVELIGFRTK